MAHAYDPLGRIYPQGGVPVTSPTAPVVPGPTTGATSSSSATSSSAATGDQRRAAGNLGLIGNYNADSTKEQLHRANQNYDLADQQNRQLADVEKKQNARKGAADRFGQQRLLQASAKGVLGAAGNTLNGSGLGMLIDMLRGREDLDNTAVLNILTQNQNAVDNALNESLNTNVIARNDAASNAEFALRGLEADQAAQINNINPDLFVAPGSGGANFGSEGYADARRTPANAAALAGYFMQAPQIRQPAPQVAGASYFDTLLNSYRRS